MPKLWGVQDLIVILADLKQEGRIERTIGKHEELILLED
jgi:hypothetical protein